MLTEGMPGELEGLGADELREVVEASFPTETFLPETDGMGALVMDADCWNKLTDAQRSCVERSVARWMDACLEVSNQFYDTAIQHIDRKSVV